MKIIKTLILLSCILLVGSTTTVNAQVTKKKNLKTSPRPVISTPRDTSLHVCGTDAHMKEYFRKNPAEKAKHEAFRKRIMEKVAVRKQAKANRTVETEDELMTIPLHIIVIYPEGAEVGSLMNPSMEEIQKSVHRLNQDFAGMNKTPTTQSECDLPIRYTGQQNLKYEFALATKDPNDNPTNGVTRLESIAPDNYSYKVNYIHLTDYMNVDSIWKNEYLNVILIPGTTDDRTIGTSYIGMLEYGGDGLPEYNSFIVSTPRFYLATTTQQNHTLSHETGHYLGLNHAFDCGVGSTQNYMDYYNNMTYFSESQKDLIRAATDIGEHPMLTAADKINIDPVLKTVMGKWGNQQATEEVNEVYIYSDQFVDITNNSGETKVLSLIKNNVGGYKAKDLETNTMYWFKFISNTGKLKVRKNPIDNPSQFTVSFLELNQPGNQGVNPH